MRKGRGQLKFGQIENLFTNGHTHAGAGMGVVMFDKTAKGQILDGKVAVANVGALNPTAD
jgi:hypothetical protein